MFNAPLLLFASTATVFLHILLPRAFIKLVKLRFNQWELGHSAYIVYYVICPQNHMKSRFKPCNHIALNICCSCRLFLWNLCLSWIIKNASAQNHPWYFEWSSMHVRSYSWAVPYMADFWQNVFLPFLIQCKAFSSCAKHSNCHPVSQLWDVWSPLRHLNLVGLVSRGEPSKSHRSQNSKIHDNLNTPKYHCCWSWMDYLFRCPFLQLGRLVVEQCETFLWVTFFDFKEFLLALP